jgi:hypothetical protein
LFQELSRSHPAPGFFFVLFREGHQSGPRQSPGLQSPILALRRWTCPAARVAHLPIALSARTCRWPEQRVFARFLRCARWTCRNAGGRRLPLRHRFPTGTEAPEKEQRARLCKTGGQATMCPIFGGQAIRCRYVWSQRGTQVSPSPVLTHPSHPLSVQGILPGQLFASHLAVIRASLRQTAPCRVHVLEHRAVGLQKDVRCI